MKIAEEIRSIADAYRVPMAHMVISYSPTVGIEAWWIKSKSTTIGFKWPEFVMQTLECDKHQDWEIKKVYSGLDCNTSYVSDEARLDLAPQPFLMKAQEFIHYYGVMWGADKNMNEETVNVVGYDYNRIRQLPDGVKPHPRVHSGPITKIVDGKIPLKITFESLMKEKYPDNLTVRSENLDDLDEFRRYNKLRHKLFDGWDITDEAQLSIVRRLINNKDEFIRLLKGL